MEGHVPGVDSSCGLPAQVEAETVDSLGVAQALERWRTMTLAITRAAMVGRPRTDSP